MAQEFDRTLPDLALLHVGCEVGHPQAVEHLYQVAAVVLVTFAENQDVVQVRRRLLYAAEGPIDEALEGVARVVMTVFYILTIYTKRG